MRRSLSLPVLIMFALTLLAFAAAPAQVASAASVGDCATEAAANPKGWYKSRFEWCKIEPLSAGERVNGRVVGGVSALYDIAVTTERLTQHVHVAFQIRAITSWGTLTNAVLSVQLPCSGCTPGAARGRTAPLSNWDKDLNTTFDFTGSLGGGRDKIAGHSFYPRFVLNGGLVYSTEGTAFRCDQAYYINSKRPGCIFPGFIPKFTFSLSGKATQGGKVPQVAQHIDDALHRPASTKPAWASKTIPSRLHRLFYDKARRKDNRDTAIAACKRYFPAYKVNDPRQDCDEYPFATTVEGAAKGDIRYSARPLDPTQNQSAGSQVNQWWEQNRVIEGDEFDIGTGR